jgi:hypothetical protein
MAARRLSSRAKNLDHLDNIAATSKNDVARAAAIKTMEQIDVAAVAQAGEPASNSPACKSSSSSDPTPHRASSGPSPPPSTTNRPMRTAG